MSSLWSSLLTLCPDVGTVTHQAAPWEPGKSPLTAPARSPHAPCPRHASPMAQVSLNPSPPLGLYSVAHVESLHRNRWKATDWSPCLPFVPTNPLPTRMSVKTTNPAVSHSSLKPFGGSALSLRHVESLLDGRRKPRGIPPPRVTPQLAPSHPVLQHHCITQNLPLLFSA